MTKSIPDELLIRGLLMLSDPFLPSVARLVAGAPIKGSWWSHPKGHEIWRELNRLDEHPDALATKLVSGKVTYVHRRLWEPFLSVCASRSGWQTDGIGRSAKALLTKVEKEGEVRVDSLGPGGREGARVIEQRLLVFADEIHTEKGYHAKVLSVWSRCPKFAGIRLSPRGPGEGMATLEATLDGLNKEFGGRGTLPWKKLPSP